MKDKKYRPEVDGPKVPPVTNKPIDPGFMKPRPPMGGRPQRPMPPMGGKPQRPTPMPPMGGRPPVNKPGRPGATMVMDEAKLKAIQALKDKIKASR